jgi:hypothetical protein
LEGASRLGDGEVQDALIAARRCHYRYRDFFPTLLMHKYKPSHFFPRVGGLLEAEEDAEEGLEKGEMEDEEKP